MAFLFEKRDKKKSPKQSSQERGKPSLADLVQKHSAPSRAKKAPKSTATESSSAEVQKKAVSKTATSDKSDVQSGGESFAAKKRKTKSPPRERRAKHVSFKTSATGRPSDMPGANPDIEKTRILVREIFAAGAPVHSKNYLAGRLIELEHIISAIEDKRDHVIVYGPRGWGKSSLVNTVAEIAVEAGYIVPKASCGSYASYAQMFRSFLGQIPLLYDRDVVTKRPISELSAEFDELLPEGEITAKEVTDVLERLSTTRVIMVLDEYDRIENDDFKLAIAETIKNFSDRSIRVQMIIVGVADTLDQLIGLNPSIRRNISGIQLELLTDAEVGQMMRIGEEVAGIRFKNEVQETIIKLSRNNPYNVKILLLHATQSALADSRMEVIEADVTSAARRAISDSEVLIQSEVLDVIRGGESELQKQLLFAMAMSETDRSDKSSIQQVSKAYETLTGKKISALGIGKRLTSHTKGRNPILVKRMVSGRSYYSFTDSLAAFYLRMKCNLELD